MSPLSVVVDLRIHLFVRVMVAAPVQLLLVLAAAAANPRSWIKRVIADLDRLANTSDKCRAYVGASCAQWVALIRADPKAFLKLIVNIMAKPEINDE